MQKSAESFLIHLRTNAYRTLRQFSSSVSRASEMLKDNGVRDDLFSVAPMMDYTNKHQRTLMRLLSRHATLYTEMVVCNTLIHRSDRLRSLEADFLVEEPLVMQLGGSSPACMAEAATITAKYGYSKFNINIGCPSDKVSGAGCFGAVLMKNPALVSDITKCMGDALGQVPSVKCRIGVDDEDSYEHLSAFIDHVSSAGHVSHFIIHARVAILGGKFSPKDNRTIPPLKHDFVHRLAQDFPNVRFSLNGGIKSIEGAIQHLQTNNDSPIAGVMVGRSVIDQPFLWRKVDSSIYGYDDLGYSRGEIIEKYAKYACRVENEEGEKTRHSLIKPIYNIFAATRNGKKFRRSLSEQIKDKSIKIDDVIMRALTTCDSDAVNET